MRFSYMLQNKEGYGRRIPRGQAWQWVHDLDNIENLAPILSWIDLRVSVDRLNLLNVYLDHTEITAPINSAISFGCKSQIIYTTVTTPDRVINMNLIPESSSTPH